MVFGTGTERLICAVPSLSMVVKSSAAADWARARQLSPAGMVSNDTKDLLVIRRFIVTSAPASLSKHELKTDLQLSHAYVGVEAGNRAEAAATRYRHAVGIQMVGTQTIAR